MSGNEDELPSNVVTSCRRCRRPMVTAEQPSGVAMLAVCAACRSEDLPPMQARVEAAIQEAAGAWAAFFMTPSEDTMEKAAVGLESLAEAAREAAEGQVAAEYWKLPEAERMLARDAWWLEAIGMSHMSVLEEAQRIAREAVEARRLAGRNGMSAEQSIDITALVDVARAACGCTGCLGGLRAVGGHTIQQPDNPRPTPTSCLAPTILADLLRIASRGDG